jgi:prepilin-type processing-associated H-X9-DG protein
MHTREICRFGARLTLLFLQVSPNADICQPIYRGMGIARTGIMTGINLLDKVGPNNQARKPGGFTLTELIVVLGTICVFIGLLLPVFGGVRRKAGVLDCKENLRLTSVALNAYAADHSDSLPGPQWRSVYYTYMRNSELIYGMASYLAPYLGSPPVSNVLQTNSTLRCPAAKQIATNLSFQNPTYTTVSYGLATYVTNGAGSGNRITNVFGYPFSLTGGVNSSGISGMDDPPAKIAKISRPSENWAIVDLDQRNAPSATSTYYPLLPKRPVHNNRPDGGKEGATRNYLYFDGSVRSVTESF